MMAAEKIDPEKFASAVSAYRAVKKLDSELDEDSKLNERLERWARWRTSGPVVSGQGSSGQSFEFSAGSSETIVYQEEMEIEALVSKMAVTHPKHAQVLRCEYGALTGPYNPEYDTHSNRSQQYSADLMSMKLWAYKRYLSAARDLIRFALA